MHKPENDILLCAAPFIPGEEQEGENYILTHLVTGQFFSLGEKAYRVIRHLRKPVRFSALHEAFSDTGKEQLDELIAYFISRGLVYDAEKPAEEQSLFLCPAENRLFGAGHYNPATAAENDLVIIGLPFGKGNSVSDECELAPKALRRFAAGNRIETASDGFFTNLGAALGAGTDFTPLEQAVLDGKLKDAGDLYIHPQEAAGMVYTKVGLLTEKLAGLKQKPLFIGGDHSVSLPVIRALAEYHPRMLVIQLDAHTDTYNNPIDLFYSELVPHHHGNVMLGVAELPQVEGIYQLGIRGVMNAGTRHIGKKQHVFYPEAVLRLLAGTEDPGWPDGIPVYLSIDIDVLRPELAPGTATPVAGGITPEELARLIALVAARNPLLGADLVEINPRKDPGGLTLQIATGIVFGLLNALSKT